jgi:hypothetical protein
MRDKLPPFLPFYHGNRPENAGRPSPGIKGEVNLNPSILSPAREISVEHLSKFFADRDIGIFDTIQRNALRDMMKTLHMQRNVLIAYVATLITPGLNGLPSAIADIASRIVRVKTELQPYIEEWYMDYNEPFGRRQWLARFKFYITPPSINAVQHILTLGFEYESTVGTLPEHICDPKSQAVRDINRELGPIIFNPRFEPETFVTDPSSELKPIQSYISVLREYME